MGPLRLSPVFKRKPILPKTVGKKRELKESVKDITKTKKEETWPSHNGEQKRYREIFFDILKREPINHLIKKRNKNPQIMILGPGKGQYISELQSELMPYEIKPKIDVLGLQKTINTKFLENKTVRTDFSRSKALEKISENPKQNKTLISKISEKYDLVMAPASVGLHTLYPAFNVFNVSCMLRKGGVAYIEIPTKEVIERPQFKVPEEHKKRMITQVGQLSKIVGRFLEAYKGEKFSKEFSFSNIDYSTVYDNPDGTKTILPKRYIKVERK